MDPHSDTLGYSSLLCAEPQKVGEGTVLVHGPDGLVPYHGQDYEGEMYRARGVPYGIGWEGYSAVMVDAKAIDGPPEPPDIKQIHNADGALAALVLEARELIGPDLPNRVTAIMLGEGYDLGWLPVPGVLVLYVPPGVDVRDIEAGHELLFEIVDELANKATA